MGPLRGACFSEGPQWIIINSVGHLTARTSEDWGFFQAMKEHLDPNPYVIEKVNMSS